MKQGIITTEPVDKTFEGEPCLLRRTIVSTFKEKEEKGYVIRTERCKYVEVQKQVFNEEGNSVLDENGDRVFETVEELKIINRKDQDTVKKYSFSKIDELYQQLKEEISLTSSLSQFETDFERHTLLLQTRQDGAWGIEPNVWVLEGENK